MSRRTQDKEKAELIKSVMLQTRASYWSETATTSAQNWDRWLVDCNEVYPDLFIGDKNAALNKQFLLCNRITHVVNTAEGAGVGMVTTGEDYYRKIGIAYMGLPLMDLSVTNVAMYFESVANFIHDALRRKGRVLVHCYMGMSRSAVFTLAYLVLKCNMSACTAMTLIRRSRNIHPNDGFIHQLAVLDNKIMRRQEIYII